MKVLVVGGGSGGHITPAVAVIREILEKRPRTKVEFWTDRKYYKNGCAGEVKQKGVEDNIFGCGKLRQGSFEGMLAGL